MSIEIVNIVVSMRFTRKFKSHEMVALHAAIPALLNHEEFVNSAYFRENYIEDEGEHDILLDGYIYQYGDSGARILVLPSVMIAVGDTDMASITYNLHDLLHQLNKTGVAKTNTPGPIVILNMMGVENIGRTIDIIAMDNAGDNGVLSSTQVGNKLTLHYDDERRHKMTVLIFESGKVIYIGSRTESSIQRLSRSVHRRIVGF